MEPIPELRVSRANAAPIRPDGAYVLYWMIANRRTRWNHALDHAIWQARNLGRPLIVLEALRIGYRWASDRIHRFIIEGMTDQRDRFEPSPIAYYPYLEPAPGEGAGLVEALAKDACLVVTDTFPCFFLPRMVAAVAGRLPVALEAIDANCILPLRAADRTFTAAVHFRRHLQKTVLPWLEPSAMPLEEPLHAAAHLPRAAVPPHIAARWPAATAETLGAGLEAFVSRLPIDHSVPAVPFRGGEQAARRALDAFIGRKLSRYGSHRNEPEDDVPSGLSPYLHFGHIGVHEVMARVLEADGWHPGKVAPKVTASREGWWGLSPNPESFVDELLTWREIGYNFCFHRPDDYDRFESLPEWSQRTLAAHASDPRPYVYDRATLEAAKTHDPLWNAAQRQLRGEGRIHNYLRMLWGKKILEWSETPELALEHLIELNNRWSIDGRNPNSYSGIFWTLGRFDRAWGPERPIFGSVRYMSSDNTAKKVRVKDYLKTWGPGRRLL
jgi:deoxyribodipyrimidine photo-lyase